MKKKNVIGHMTTANSFSKGWFRRLNLLPKFLCLVLAVLLWLCVTALVDSGKDDIGKSQDPSVVEYAEE